MDFTLVGLWHEMGFVARAVVVVLVDHVALLARHHGRAAAHLPARAQAVAPLHRGAGAAGRGDRAGCARRSGSTSASSGSPVASVIGAGLRRVRARRSTGRRRAPRRVVRGRRGRQPRDGAEQGAPARRAAPRDAGAGDGRVVGAVRRPVRHRRRHHHRVPEARRPDQGGRRHRHRLGRHRRGAGHHRRRPRASRSSRSGSTTTSPPGSTTSPSTSTRRPPSWSTRSCGATRRDAAGSGHPRRAPAARGGGSPSSATPRGRCGRRST